MVWLYQGVPNSSKWACVFLVGELLVQYFLGSYIGFSLFFHNSSRRILVADVVLVVFDAFYIAFVVLVCFKISLKLKVSPKAEGLLGTTLLLPLRSKVRQKMELFFVACCLASFVVALGFASKVVASDYPFNYMGHDTKIELASFSLFQPLLGVVLCFVLLVKADAMRNVLFIVVASIVQFFIGMAVGVVAFGIRVAGSDIDDSILSSLRIQIIINTLASLFWIGQTLAKVPYTSDFIDTKYRLETYQNEL